MIRQTPTRQNSINMCRGIKSKDVYRNIKGYILEVNSKVPEE